MDYLTSLEYIDSLFKKYKQNPNQLDPKWQLFFQGAELGQDLSANTFDQKELAVFQLIKSYRESGYLNARLDPLGLKPVGQNDFLKNQGLTEKDLDKPYRMANLLGLKEGTPLREVVSVLEKSYCGTLSLQAKGVPKTARAWLFREMESGDKFQLTADQKKNIFYELAKTEALEKFLHSRFMGAKRFSIEGGDALIPMLEHLAESSGPNKVQELIIGMAHRGRLNVLNNFMDQATEITLMEFDGGKALAHFDFEGDVKYHMGYSSVKKFANGGACNILLAYNPSHLEAVSPVVCGIARARQRALKDQQTREKVLPVLIHGDAAFIGQGVVSETLQLSQLEGWTTGGALHIILNNQVGFTTDPTDARTSGYVGDLASSIGAPVLLVNADDLLACVRAVDMALRFRQQFRSDIFIDLVCYRRYGHNEGDEPAFTQPKMVQKIKQHPTALAIYSQLMERENLISAKEAKLFYEQKMQNLQSLLEEVRKNQKSINKQDLKGTLWAPYKKTTDDDFFKPCDTCPSDKHLEQTLKALTEIPKDFNLHPKLKKLILNRAKSIKQDTLDWGLVELLAYGTLCLEGHPVRLSGQDSKRGTFSHRHAVYFDQKTGKEFSPLALLNPEKGEFCVYNSPLSEMAVLGFEYGNASADHSFFTAWEAQFGDFANGAQIIIDQFITSGEEKWMQSSGLVLLLPHGYEGQGPEHSSARLERFLQLSAQGNMQVCQPTTPAQLFHLLRRQMKRDFRKPLIVMTPKSLLRHPEVVSCKKDLIRSKGFRSALADPRAPKASQVKTLVLCSGKVYYDLKKEREQTKELSQTALVRLEQLYPFPHGELAPFLNGYSKLNKVIWAQEEPANMGPAWYIKPRLRAFMDEIGLSHIPLVCVSRDEKASPATGSLRGHQEEYQALVKKLFVATRT